MMESKTLPPNFWDEDIKYASYIQNRVPHKNLYAVTPFESWSGNKPDVPHFNIFGSTAGARIQLDKRRDLEPQSKEFLFFGYSEYSKWYKLINLSTQKSLIKHKGMVPNSQP